MQDLIKTINRKVYSKDHDGNLDEAIDQPDTPIYAHIDKPLVLELYPRKRKHSHVSHEDFFIISYRPIVVKMA